MPRVRPELGDERHAKDGKRDETDVDMDEESGWVAWVKRRWWAKALLILLAAGVVTAVIVGTVCGTVGCPRKQSNQQDSQGGPLRLIVTFNLDDIDALDVVPALLRQYTTRLKLNSSLLQILDFVDEDVLREAQKYLLNNTNLQLLTRDFPMSYNPHGVTRDIASLSVNGAGVDLNAVLAAASGSTGDVNALINSLIGSTGRRLQQSAVNDPFVINGTQWHHARIRSPAAWSVTKGSQPVIVAVIDSGFDMTHPDLVGRFWVNKGEIPNNGIDDDQNGFVDDYNGYAFKGACKKGTAFTATTSCICEGTGNLEPSDEHGTHVAGLVGATLNNLVGGSGTAPNVQLMLLKVADCSPDGEITAATVFMALDYAYKMGAHIVTLSVGSKFEYNENGGSQPRTQALDDRYVKFLQSYTTAVQPLANKGVFMTAAAGNENLDLNELSRLGYTYVPCLVPLGNVMCVGASDLVDGRAFFSNFGQKVDLSAPGMSILSTLWEGATARTPVNHYFGQMNGSSQSTPITAGVAALVASILGTNDKNYFRATQIRDILIKSAEYSPGLQGASSSGKRLNAFNAVQLALDAVTTVGSGTPSLTPILPAGALPSATVQVVGFTESYWPNLNPLVLDSTGLVQLDQSIRGGGPSFSAFKFTSGVMVNMSAWLQLNVSGLHAFTLTYPVTYLGGRITVNGARLAMSTAPTSGSCSFRATAPGWYQVSYLFLPVVAGAVSVTLTPPGATSAGLYPSSYVTWSRDSFVAPTLTNNYTDDVSPSWGYNSGWFVFFNRTSRYGLNFNASTVNALYKYVKLDGYWETQLLVDDLTLAVNDFRTTLLPGPVDSLMGYATTIWNVTGLPPRISFIITCKGCGVFLNGQLVLENWFAYGSRLALPRSSSCITINPSAVNYRLEVKFVASGDSALFLQYTPCDTFAATAVNGIQRASLSTAVLKLDNSQAQRNIGWIGGVQCDVWRTLPGSTTVPRINPLYKFRLPGCASPESFASSCSSPWSFTLNGAIPGGLAAAYPSTSLFSVRCWAYTNSSVPRLLSTAPSGLTSSVHLAGLTRYRASPLGGVTYRAPVPGEIRYLPAQQHQLIVEWVGATTMQTLSLLGNGLPLPITLKGFRLPLWVTADAEGSPYPVDPNLRQLVLGAGGAYIQGFAATTADIVGLFPSDLSTVSTVSSAVSTSSSALNVAYSLPTSPALSNKVWYAVCEGYYWTLDGARNLNTFTFDQAAGAAVQVIAGDVVIRNAPAYNAASAAVNNIAVQVEIPGGYLRLRIVTKLRNPLGTVSYNWRVSSATVSPTSMDINYWLRARWQPQTP